MSQRELSATVYPFPTPPSRTERPARPWLLAIEIALAAGLIAVVTIMALQAGTMFAATIVLNRAAAAGAHEATLPGASLESIEAASARVTQSLWISQYAERPLVRLRGQAEFTSSLAGFASGDEVSVSLGLWATDIAPDLLRWLGLSLDGRKVRELLVAQTVKLTMNSHRDN